jgi:hypothetical protein
VTKRDALLQYAQNIIALKKLEEVQEKLEAVILGEEARTRRIRKQPRSDTNREALIKYAAANNGEVRPAQAARALGCDRGTVYAVLHRLERAHMAHQLEPGLFRVKADHGTETNIESVTEAVSDQPTKETTAIVSKPPVDKNSRQGQALEIIEQELAAGKGRLVVSELAREHPHFPRQGFYNAFHEMVIKRRLKRLEPGVYETRNGA